MLNSIIAGIDFTKYKLPVLTIQKPDDSKTPNDFGFQKLCFPLKFAKKSETTELKLETLISSNEETKKKDKKDTNIQNEAKDNIEKLVEEIKTIQEETKNDNKKIQSNYKQPQVNIYQEHFSKYKDFINSYMYNEENSTVSSSQYLQQEKREIKQGDEVMDYKERKEYAKKLMLNSRFGNKTMPHQSQGEKLQYEMWKASSKFNQILSFLMYDHLDMVQ